jgi:5-methylcytosine-specific restriction endonuclease McrA
MQTKACYICARELPATSEFFTRDKTREDGLHPYCKTCRNEKRSKERHSNPNAQEKDRERARQWFYENRERARAKTKELYHANREERIKQTRQWREQNPERYRANNANRYPKYYTEHREEYRAWVRNRRARQRQAPGKHTPADIEHLYDQQQGKCAYCQCSLQNGYHVDHIVPLARGGSNDPSNLALACASCNKSKGDRLLSEWNPIG